MLTNNESPKRCLILSTYPNIHALLSPLCEEFNFIPDFLFDRKSALNYFLKYKHSFIVIDAQFLPRFAFRLVQLFKIAHREPAVLILNTSGKNLTGFERLEGFCIKIAEQPFSQTSLRIVLIKTMELFYHEVRSIFFKNFIAQIVMVLPLLIALLILLLCHFKT